MLLQLLLMVKILGYQVPGWSGKALADIKMLRKWFH